MSPWQCCWGSVTHEQARPTTGLSSCDACSLGRPMMDWLIDLIARIWRTVFGQSPAVPPPHHPPAPPRQPTQPTPMLVPKPARPAPKARWPKRKGPAKAATRSGQPKTRQQASDARRAAASTARPAAKAGRASSPPLPAAAIDRVIETLPHRTMLELRQQWLNAIERGDDPQSKRFRDAVLAEWQRRARHAQTPADYFR